MDMVTPLTTWSSTKMVSSALISKPVLPTKVHNSDSGTVELVPTSTLIQPSGNMMPKMASSTSVSSMTRILKIMRFGSARMIFGTKVNKILETKMLTGTLTCIPRVSMLMLFHKQPIKSLLSVKLKDIIISPKVFKPLNLQFPLLASPLLQLLESLLVLPEPWLLSPRWQMLIQMISNKYESWIKID